MPSLSFCFCEKYSSASLFNVCLLPKQSFISIFDRFSKKYEGQIFGCLFFEDRFVFSLNKKTLSLSFYEWEHFNRSSHTACLSSRFRFNLATLWFFEIFSAVNITPMFISLINIFTDFYLWWVIAECWIYLSHVFANQVQGMEITFEKWLILDDQLNSDKINLKSQLITDKMLLNFAIKTKQNTKIESVRVLGKNRKKTAREPCVGNIYHLLLYLLS